MGSLRCFEEIEAWQQARVLTRRVYECSALGAFAKDFGLQGQIRRASVSIMSNIAEGFGRGGSAEFAQFLAVAKGSATEVQSQLYVALDARYISPTDFEELQELARSTNRLLAGFMNYLRRSPLRGRKFVRTTSTQPKNQGLETQGPETKD